MYGGAIYLPDSQYSVLRIDSLDIDNNPVVLKNNSSSASGGAIFGQTMSSITIFYGIFKDNISYSNGGAINSCGGIVIYDALFNGNKAAAKGGAIYHYLSRVDNTARELLIYKAVFNSNQASRGGAISLYTDANLSKGTIGKIYNSSFESNYAFATTSSGGFPIEGDPEARTSNGNGGAIYATNKSSLLVIDSSFEKNESERNGGAIYISYDSNSLIGNTRFESSTAGGNGGAIYVSASSLDVHNSNFVENKSNNSEYGGGALYFTTSEGNILGSTFESNNALTNGGAIAIYSSSNVKIDSSEFTLNSCEALGGGIYINKSFLVSTDTIFSSNASNKNGGALYITNSAEFKGDYLEFYNNHAKTSGGAMYIYTDATAKLGKYSSGQETIFDSNSAETYGGGIYISGAADLTIYNFSSSNNSASSGGFIYETTTNTLVNLINGTSQKDICSTPNAGATLWSNTNKASLRILNYEYPANTLQGKSFTFSYIDEEDVENLVWVENEISSEITSSRFGVVPYAMFYSLEDNKKLDNNFASLNTAVFENINGKDVIVDSFIRKTNESLNNPIFGKGILIYQTIRYKMMHMKENVSLSLTSFHLSVVTAVCINPNSPNYGKMKSLYDGDTDDEGFVRISALLIQAAKVGIHVTVIAQTDANPVDLGPDYSFEEYFTSHLNEVCVPEIEGRVSEYLTFRVARWTSYGDKAATDMMHLKSCYSSHYLDWNNQDHINTIWLGSSNVDGITEAGYNGNNGEQTGVIITNHAELYNVLFNYTNLMVDYCSQEEADAFRYLVFKRSVEQVSLLKSNQKVLKNEQIVYIGTENDSIFELYFTSLGGNFNTWDVIYNPYMKFLEKMNTEEARTDYIEFVWNNPKILNDTNYLDVYFKKLARIFLENKNKNSKLLLHVNVYSSDFNPYFTGLIENENIGLLSINQYSYIWFHSKDLHMSYKENGIRQYVNILNSLNMHTGSLYYQTNHILVIKENDIVGHSIYDLFLNVTTYGQIVK